MKFHKWLYLVIALHCINSFAAGPSNEWSQGWQPSSSTSALQLQQADVIAKKESGYYGPSITNFNSYNTTYTTIDKQYSTTTAGTLNETLISIYGNSNNVTPSLTTSSSSTGSQDGSITTGPP